MDEPSAPSFPSPPEPRAPQPHLWLRGRPEDDAASKEDTLSANPVRPRPRKCPIRPINPATSDIFVLGRIHSPGRSRETSSPRAGAKRHRPVSADQSDTHAAGEEEPCPEQPWGSARS